MLYRDDDGELWAVLELCELGGLDKAMALFQVEEICDPSPPSPAPIAHTHIRTHISEYF